MVRTKLPGMDSFESIIVALGGTGAVAAALGQSDSTVSSWRTRGIPAGHWAAVVALAASLGKSDITLEVLAGLAARKLEEARA
jgi:acid phosphatase family membrane protein YuiD